MANDFEEVVDKVGEGIKDGAEAVVHAVEKVVGIVDKTDKVLHTVVLDSSELKDPLIQVGKAAVALQGEFAAVIAAKGADWPLDEDLVVKIKAFFETDVEAIFIPAVEKVYGDIETDLDASSPASPAAAAPVSQDQEN